MQERNIRFKDAQLQRIETLSKKRGTTVAETIRELIDAALDAQSTIERAESMALARDDVLAMREQLLALQQQITESQRVPSFREFRARAVAEKWSLPGEPRDAVLYIARAYYRRFKVWPDPQTEHRFGAAIEGFPRHPE